MVVRDQKLEALAQKLEDVFEAEEAAEATAAAELAALCVATAARALELARSAEAQFMAEARLAMAAVAEASAAERAVGEAVAVAVPAAVAVATAAEAAADPVSKPETAELVVDAEKAEAERLDAERLATEAAAAAQAERLAAEKANAECIEAHPRPTCSSVRRDPGAAGPAEMGVASSVSRDPDYLWRGDPGPISVASYPTLPDSARASSPVRSALRSSLRPASARPASTTPPASTRGAQQPRTLSATEQKHVEAEAVHLLLGHEWPLKIAPGSCRAPAYWVPLLPAARAAWAQPAAESAEPRAMPKAAKPPVSACTSTCTCTCTSASASRSATRPAAEAPAAAPRVAAPSRARPAISSAPRPRTQEAPRTMAEANATEVHSTKIHGTLEVESGRDIEGHSRSVSPPKPLWEHGMSSWWESAEFLHPRPPVAVESPRPKPRPKPMRIALPPSLGVVLGGRPVHMPRPRPREPISQQDVYALLLEQNDPKAELARQRAAERVVAIQITEGRIARQSERAERLEAKTRDAAERTRFAKLFGLPFRHINRCHSRRPLLVVASGGDADKAKAADAAEWRRRFGSPKNGEYTGKLRKPQTGNARRGACGPAPPPTRRAYLEAARAERAQTAPAGTRSASGNVL